MSFPLNFLQFYPKRHFVSIYDLTLVTTNEILRKTAEMEWRVQNSKTRMALKYTCVKRDPKADSEHWEPMKLLVLTKGSGSTRTAVAFIEAMEKLGGKALWLPLEQTSKVKDESYESTARNLAPYYDCIAIRDDHRADAPQKMIESIQRYNLPTRVFNIGNGDLEHPFQTIKDLYTIQKSFPVEFETGLLTYIFLGDFEYSRVIHSDLLALRYYGAKKIYLVGPKGKKLPPWLETDLANSKLSVTYAVDLLDIAGEGDVFYFARLQKNLRNKPVTEQEEMEYAAKFGATDELRKIMKSSAIALHPQPHNREISQFLDLTDRRFIYNTQADYGLPVAMALLYIFLAPEVDLDSITHISVPLSGTFDHVSVRAEDITALCASDNCFKARVFGNTNWFQILNPHVKESLRGKLPLIPCDTCHP